MPGCCAKAGRALRAIEMATLLASARMVRMVRHLARAGELDLGLIRAALVSPSPHRRRTRFVARFALEEEAMTARLRSLPALLAALPALVASPALAQHSEAAHPWSYDGAHGPTHWGDLPPSYATCKRGKHQTPTAIRGAKTADLPAIEFSYAPSRFRITGTGHSVSMHRC